MDFPLIQHEDYFDGLSSAGPLPEKVLFFTRTARSTLDSSQPHRHSRYNLFIALAGDCALVLDGTIHRLAEGLVLLTHPWQSFRFVYGKDEALRWIVFGFDLPAVAGAGVGSGSGAGSDGDGRLPRNEARLMDAFFSRLANAAASRYFESGSGPWLPPLLGALLAELPRLPAGPAASAEIVGGDQGLVARAQRYVLDRLSSPVTVADIASHCAYSESRLRQIFPAAAGISPGAFIRKVKLNEASRLLASTGLSVSAVADACGFSSLYAFSRCFARELGVPPLRFRGEQRS